MKPKETNSLKNEDSYQMQIKLAETVKAPGTEQNDNEDDYESL